MAIDLPSEYNFALRDEDGEHEVFYFPPVRKEMQPERDRCVPNAAHASRERFWVAYRTLSAVRLLGGQRDGSYQENGRYDSEKVRRRSW